MTTATLTEAPSLTCPACLDQVEFLFSTTGVCLDCEIDLYNHTVSEYEEREREEWGAELVQVCGVDL